MEGLGVTLYSGIYRGRKVLVTGHTGFKGGWLSLWLKNLGAIVTGISLPSLKQPNHWEMLSLSITDLRFDIRNESQLKQAIQKIQPEIVFHLAAQSLVRLSYVEPLDTWSTNVIGTASVLEACRNQKSIRAVVVITTDKCYENREWVWGYRETDRLGGHDPYSASKAGAELVAMSYRNSFFDQSDSLLLATARAGNVIGGGDWSADRLIPDIVRALDRGQSIEIRSPNSTRPWQHVLESLSGYLLLGQKLFQGEKICADAWNFGPERDGNRPVCEVMDNLSKHWPSMKWHTTDKLQPHESTLLYLDSAKSRSSLNWKPIWNIDITLKKTAEWYSVWLESRKAISEAQLQQFIADAGELNAVWTKS